MSLSKVDLPKEKKTQKKNKTKLHVTCKCTIHMEFNICKLKLLINRNGVLILFFIYYKSSSAIYK